MKNFYWFIGVIVVFLLVFSCEGRPDDSDAPEWAGGNIDANPHVGKNDTPQDKQGDDYGDLYVLIRDQNGVPVMNTEYWIPLVMAFDADGEPISSTDPAYSEYTIVGEYVALNIEDGEIELSDGDFYQEVDFGRLNLVRAPAILEKAMNEVEGLLTYSESNDFKGITTDFCGRLVIVYGEGVDWDEDVDEDDDKTIDSPRDNLAIYKELMQNGFGDRLSMLTDWFADIDILYLAASAFAAGSDKTGTIIKDEVAYMNQFMNAYDEDDAIQLSDIYSDCEDDYYANLWFYDFTNFTYDRQATYENKYVLVTIVDGTNTISYKKSIYQLGMGFEDDPEGMPDQEGFFSNSKNDFEYIAGFTAACDDAVHVLGYIHFPPEDYMIEYLGEE